VRDRIATGIERGPASAVGDAVRMTTTPRGLVISLAASRFFAPASAELTAEALPVLESIGAVLAPLRLSVRIEGHTDDRPIATEHFPSNWELSAARATAVVRYLLEHFELAPERLTAAAYASYRPVAPNADEEGRSRNRRVDVVVLSPLEARQEADPAMQELEAREALDSLR
jgi:chemotaxis protein MotB